jgi:hypothetical protein
MPIELRGHDTRVLFTDEHSGMNRLIVGEDLEIPFLIAPLTGEHFFTGVWPPPPDALGYEPLSSPASFTRTSEGSAVWHQDRTAYSHVETRIEYEIVGRGMVEARFETRSHASSYPHGYVGLFWAAMPQPGGQRGIHLLVPAGDAGPLRWHYFQGGGDSWTPRANTVLGPNMPSSEYSPGHPLHYYLAESGQRFALPVQVGRWRDLCYSLEVDTADVGFTDVLLGTGIGGPSWDVFWRLRPGEFRSVCCRVTVGPWEGWEAVEERYRRWAECVAPAFAVDSPGRGMRQPFSAPETSDPPTGSGLGLSGKLFQTRGREILERLGLLGRCSVGCFGGTSQNAGLDDETSRDHVWGPHLTFLLRAQDWEEHHVRLERAIDKMPDEADGTRWVGYDGPLPRRTGVWEMNSFLQTLTGLDARPETDREWVAHLGRASFLGRRWTEQLFDAGQGEVFHDPGNQFIELWRHWTAYVPPDIHRALLARSLFRVWNAGPEYNLERARARGDGVSLALCRTRLVEEVLELAFCWNERFVPQLKWRPAHFRRLPICPTDVRKGVESLCESASDEEHLDTASSVVRSIKMLLKDLYHVSADLADPLPAFAHAMRDSIADAEVMSAAALDW